MQSTLALLPRRALMAFVRGYRLVLSPWLGSSCRFEPSCSSYSLEALDKHGAAVGTYLTAARIVRCNPFCAAGHDPVPERAPAFFLHLTTAARRAVGASSPSSKPEPNP